MRPTLAGRLAANAKFPDPEFTKVLALTVGAAQLVPMANITARTLLVASRPNPVTVMMVDAPAEPARTVNGEKDVAFPTNRRPLPALVYVVVDAAR